MIATCLVNQKTSRRYEFDYLIPQDLEIKKYSLVEVPFLKRKTTAVVIDIKEHSAFANKQIIRVLSGPIFTTSQIALSQKIAYEFLSNPSLAIFSFLPDLNIGDLKKLPMPQRIAKSRNFKIQFVEADFWQRIQFYIQSLPKEGQNLIVLPEIISIAEVRRMIEKLDPSKEVYIWHSGISKREKAKIWVKLISGHHCFVVSTRHGLFLPFTNLKTICLDQPFDFGYFEDQQPRYNAYQASKIVQKEYLCNLILGDSICPPAIYAQIKKAVISRVKFSDKISIRKAPELPNSQASESLVSLMTKSRKILVTGFFKDFTRIICKDCDKPIICPGCQNEIFSDQNSICLKCQKHPPLACPHCQSISLAKTGLSLTKIKNEIEKNFNCQASLDPDENRKVTVCSIKDLNKLKPIYDLAIFPHLEIYNNFPIVNIKIELLRAIREMPTLGVSEIFLLTKNNNLLADLITSHKWDRIILEDLKSRKNDAIPPFTRFFEVEAKPKQLADLEKIIPELIQTDKDKYIALVAHKKVPQIQDYFASKTEGIKARLDSPDF